MPGPYAVRVKTADGWQDLAMLGPAGPTGATGPTGAGVPVGGTTGQVLAKKSATNFDTEWAAGAGSWKQPVKAVSTSSIYNTTGEMTVDGVPLVAGDRCLLTAQSLPRDNGIWVVSLGAWTRATDADTWNELATAAVFVEQGTTGNADSGWVCTANQGGTLGTTAVTWAKFTGSGSGGAGGHTIQDEGVSLTARTKMNFVGGGVTATDDSANDRTVITVPAVDVAAGRQTANGATTDIAGSWKAIPIGTFLSEAADAFTISANSVTVKDAGWYHVSASLLSPQGAVASTFLSLSTSTSAGDGDIANSAGATIYSRSSASGSVKLAAGAKVYVYGWSNGASPTNVNLVAFSIEKIGGPKGEKGDTGGNATVPFDNLHVIGAAGEIAFGTGWGAWSQCAFRKDPLGKVMFRGTMKCTANFSFGTASATLFTLPVGYRPADNISQKVVVFEPDGATTSMSLCTVSIATSGAVTIQGRIAGVTTSGLAGSYVWLHELDFDTETVIAMPTGPQGPAGGTMDASAFSGDSSGASTALAAATWKTIPCTRAVTVEPASGDYVINGDGSVTVVKAGWYSISATAFFGGGASGAIYLTIGGVPNTEGTWAESDVTSSGALGSTSTSAVKLAAGTQVYVTGYSGAAANNIVLRRLDIARVGGPKGDKGADGVAATVPIDPWHVVGATGEPAFGSAGWTANAPGLRFRKDPLGRVWIDGTCGVSGGANGSALFTLPAGYRPKQGSTFDNLQTNGAAGTWVAVSSAGVVTPSFASGSALYIDVSFDTETVTAMPTGPQGPTGATGGNATVPMDTWHTVGAAGEPAFLNGWVNVSPGTSYTSAQFRKDPLGRVYLRGMVKSGALNVASFVLPVGYRPTSNHRLRGYAYTGGSVLSDTYVTTDGSVMPLGTPSEHSFDGLSFDTDSVTAMPTGPQGPQGVAGPSTPIVLVTSLPAAPVDGQEIYYLADNASGTIWHFRYRAASTSAYKWEFLGGSRLNVATEASASVVAGTPVLNTVSYAVPLAGDWSLAWGARMYGSTAPYYGNISYNLERVRGGTPTLVGVIDFWAAAAPSLNASITPHLERTFRALALQAADTIRSSMGASGCNAVLDHVWMEVVPVRVG